MRAYIQSSKAISPQDSFSGAFPWDFIHIGNSRFDAIEPIYKDIIAPARLRRMNRVVKMGVALSQCCLKDANIEKPQAIITGTGWGCLSDTYDFLGEIKENFEENPSPATFILSTHNTIGGQIALYFDCQEYNSVYVNGKTSFDQCLFDAFILLEEGKTNILIGGIDELVEKDIELKREAGYWKSHHEDHSADPTGLDFEAIPGEGASFFLLTSLPGIDCKSCVDTVCFVQDSITTHELENILGISISEIDLILSGFNGDPATKKNYDDFYHLQLQDLQIITYKHLCGEYDTASGFALWLADQVCTLQEVPTNILPYGLEIKNKNIKRILIHHFIEPDQHAIILVSKADL
jgi:3-oxoacyl-[acyl-carrier-protein] synthase II